MSKKIDIAEIPLRIKQGNCLKKLFTFYDDEAKTIPRDVSSWVFDCDIRYFYDDSTPIVSCSFTQSGYDSNWVDGMPYVSIYPSEDQRTSDFMHFFWGIG